MDRKTLATLGLLTVTLLAACTPSAIAPPPTETISEEAPAEVVQETQQEVEPTTPPAETLAEITPTPAAEPLPMPTSRGDSLVATDPKTVNLVSGGPQLVEFFAFW